MSEEIEQATDRFKKQLESGFYRDRNGKSIVVKDGMSEEITREQARDTLRNAAWLGTNEDRERIERAVELLCGEPCNDAISRQAVLDEAFEVDTKEYGRIDVVGVDAINSLPPVTPQEPSKDMVSRGVFEQVMWERDVAIDQLKELGYGFGEKPKTGHWIETAEEYYKAVNEYGGGVDENTPYFTDNIGCSVCLAMFSTIDNETERFNYCPHCGVKMVEP